MPAVVMAYICIDTMAFLSMPDGQEAQTRSDFIAWVDAYLKAHQDQLYQYRGIDVYAARCAVLHAFGSEADLHRKDPSIILFGYHDGGMHFYNPAIDPRLVIIGTAEFLNDVMIGVSSFLDACKTDQGLRARVEGRLPKVLATFPFPHTPPGQSSARSAA